MEATMIYKGSLFSVRRLGYFERTATFVTPDNLVSQIIRHYTMQVNTVLLYKNCLLKRIAIKVKEDQESGMLLTRLDSGSSENFR